MSSSRRGGTKLANRAGDTLSITHVSHMEKGDAPATTHVSLLIKKYKKEI
jgi:hypothetical protein